MMTLDTGDILFALVSLAFDLLTQRRVWIAENELSQWRREP